MTIDKKIPIPERSKKGRWLSLVATMKSGDSVEVKNRNESIALMRAMSMLGHRCTSRVMWGGRFRVWIDAN